MNVDYEKNSEILKALSHPVRLQILEVIFSRECCVNDVSNELGISQATVSHHLSILRNRDIVCRQKHGSKTCYTVKNNLTKEIISISKRVNQ
jgi:ArsR family transcriptional regulator